MVFPQCKTTTPYDYIHEYSLACEVHFPLRDKITGGYPIIMKCTFVVRQSGFSHSYKETTAFIVKENRKYISDKKQITYILTPNGNAIPVHFKFFRVYDFTTLREANSCTYMIQSVGRSSKRGLLRRPSAPLSILLIETPY